MDSGCWRMKVVENEEDIRKGPWTLEEDSQLIAYVRLYGAHRWGSLSKLAGLKRDGKSCRMRWLNYLRPDIKHGTFTTEEDHLIIELHNKWGNKWSLIAKSLPGRTDNEIKNHWRTHIKKMSPESCSWPPSSKSKAQIKAVREKLEASIRKKKRDRQMSAIKEECSALNTLNNDSFDTSEFHDVHQALQDPEEMHQELLKESSDVDASMLQHSPILSWRDVTESPLNTLPDSEEFIWDYNSIDLWNLDDDIKNMDNQRQ